MKIENNLSFSGQFESSEVFNSTFLKTRLRVFAFGNNRNGSAFDEASFSDKARNSMKLIPIVAMYDEVTDDLEGHNVELREVDGDLELFHNTVPIGVISNDSNLTFEEVNEGTEESPEIKTYAVVDNVYLWKRYDATKRIEAWLKEGIVPKISMEIGSVVGDFNEEGYFKIEDFEFEAVAALGSDIEPCFPRAEIESYSRQNVKDEFKAMVYELSEALNLEQEGGNKEMAKQKKDEKEKVVTDYEKVDVTELEDETVANSQSDNPENVSDDSIKADEAKATDTTEDSETTVEKPEEVFEDDGGDDSGDGEDDGEDGATDPEEGEDTEEPETPDPIDPEPEPEPEEPEEPEEDEKEDGDEDIEPDTSTDDDNTSSAIKKPKKKPEDFEAKFNALQEDYETLKSQLSELQSYKRQREEEDIKAKFEGKISKEEFAQVFSDMKDSDIEAIEKELFALIGKKNYSIQQTVTENANKIKIPMKTDKSASDNPYSALEVYINK